MHAHENPKSDQPTKLDFFNQMGEQDLACNLPRNAMNSLGGWERHQNSWVGQSPIASEAWNHYADPTKTLNHDVPGGNQSARSSHPSKTINMTSFFQNHLREQLSELCEACLAEHEWLEEGRFSDADEMKHDPATRHEKHFTATEAATSAG